MSENVKTVNYDAIKSISQGNAHDGRELAIVDVRNPHEFEAGAIPGAINIPLPKLQAGEGLSAEDFRNQYLKDLPAPTDAGKGIVIHCQMGGRASKAVNILESKGYTDNLYIYKPGYSEFAAKS
ncbi:Thiosulfate sulfurtransferase/rhodanese-like domain-containing protein 3 [Coemansia sp. RSA 1722]|nr:Thiosulfate sulfurtransferase/rhodanese-like domain-containing protein 3 [Coemansia sp. RSA 486]KAJ2589301.1 Thiosulfate sulfurtransferase/rhodanese-like domain-containing protein 3 [Coemansia sp. RSA 1722]KAJ2635025.1 Thiosulfate sulfurtransferase/rhodanese-like domain-containing protein 3 [Coemansia sp. RSA 1286]